MAEHPDWRANPEVGLYKYTDRGRIMFIEITEVTNRRILCRVFGPANQDYKKLWEYDLPLTWFGRLSAVVKPEDIAEAARLKMGIYT